jgi:hypothetical protein
MQAYQIAEAQQPLVAPVACNCVPETLDLQDASSSSVAHQGLTILGVPVPVYTASTVLVSRSTSNITEAISSEMC